MATRKSAEARREPARVAQVDHVARVAHVEVTPEREAVVRGVKREKSDARSGARANVTVRAQQPQSRGAHGEVERVSHAMQSSGSSRKDAPKVAPKPQMTPTQVKATKHSAAELAAPVAQLPLTFTVVHPNRGSSMPATAADNPTAPLHAIPAEEEEQTTPTGELPPQMQMTVRRKFGELRAAIAEGFIIMEPIYARPLWSSPDNSRIAYSFVLQRDSMTRLITVPGGRTVQQFIRERDLQVDYRR